MQFILLLIHKEPVEAAEKGHECTFAVPLNKGIITN
jgi:hypothetical protein